MYIRAKLPWTTILSLFLPGVEALGPASAPKGDNLANGAPTAKQQGRRRSVSTAIGHLNNFFWVIVTRGRGERSNALTPSVFVSLVSTATTYLLSFLAEANSVAAAARESGLFSKSPCGVTVPACGGEQAPSQRAPVPVVVLFFFFVVSVIISTIDVDLRSQTNLSNEQTPTAFII